MLIGAGFDPEQALHVYRAYFGFLCGHIAQTAAAARTLLACSPCVVATSTSYVLGTVSLKDVKSRRPPDSA